MSENMEEQEPSAQSPASEAQETENHAPRVARSASSQPLWMMLNVVGVFDQVTQIVSSTGLDAGGFDLANVLSLSTVLSAVTIFSIIEVILITVLVTIVTLLYNVVSTLVGGIHVTLGDD